MKLQEGCPPGFPLLTPGHAARSPVVHLVNSLRPRVSRCGHSAVTSWGRPEAQACLPLSPYGLFSAVCFCPGPSRPHLVVGSSVPEPPFFWVPHVLWTFTRWCIWRAVLWIVPPVGVPGVSPGWAQEWHFGRGPGSATTFSPVRWGGRLRRPPPVGVGDFGHARGWGLPFPSMVNKLPMGRL